MRFAHVIEIITPKKFVLNGLWFGSKKPKRAIIHVHGLFSNAFSMAGVVEKLVDTETAVITFNNRGHDAVSDVKQIVGKKRKYHRGGTAHEIFTDCVDDIQGVINFVKKQGVKEIFLAGHSTGCQKAVYWAAKTGGRGVKGIILYAPLSDYAGDKKKPKLKTATQYARMLMRKGKKHELLPSDIWSHYVDAQRFLSLYTPDSVEEIFSYAQKGRIPRIYQSVRIPMLALFAGDDEYSERPAQRLVEWFTKETRSSHFDAVIIPKVGHSFRGGEAVLARLVKNFIK